MYSCLLPLRFSWDLSECLNGFSRPLTSDGFNHREERAEDQRKAYLSIQPVLFLLAARGNSHIPLPKVTASPPLLQAQLFKFR